MMDMDTQRKLLREWSGDLTEDDVRNAPGMVLMLMLMMTETIDQLAAKIGGTT